MQTDIHFTEAEIEQAQLMKQSGLEWQPRIGHFFYDPDSEIAAPSPYQQGVFFIHNEEALNQLGGESFLTRHMVWLPLWEQLRTLLKTMEVNCESIHETLQMHRGLETGEERLVLYKLIAEELSQDAEQYT